MHTVKPWSHPECYLGATWEGWFSAGFGQSRDSDALEQSNFTTAYETLKAFDTELSVESQDIPGRYDGESSVQIVRENHWAVGWVEWIAIHSTNEKALAAARELCDRANAYPVLNEDDWSQREWNTANDYWASESLSSRVRWLHEYAPKIPCFAARHDLSTILHTYDSCSDRLYEALSR